jgi:hypothetical protein
MCAEDATTPAPLDDVPIVLLDGLLRLPEREPICHGYACCCDWGDCEARSLASALPAPPTRLQPWDARPSTRRPGERNKEAA